MIADSLRVARLYLILLAIFTVARFIQGATGVPYERAHQVFSIVTLTFLASAIFAAFCRRWRGYGVKQALVLGLLFGLFSQVVIFTATVLSYGLGASTYFNHPTALNEAGAVPIGHAIRIRLLALFFNPIANAIAALIGWALGGLLPTTAVRADVAAPVAAANTRTA